MLFFSHLKRNIFVANALISPFNTQTMLIESFYKQQTTALLCFPKNIIPWRDSNPGLFIPEVDAMSTALRRQGFSPIFSGEKYIKDFEYNFKNYNIGSRSTKSVSVSSSRFCPSPTWISATTRSPEKRVRLRNRKSRARVGSRTQETIAQSFSPNSARDGRQVCRPAANFSVTKMQEENSMIQSPCFFELANKLVAHLMPN
jgi:hypothetical protein